MTREEWDRMFGGGADSANPPAISTPSHQRDFTTFTEELETLFAPPEPMTDFSHLPYGERVYAERLAESARVQGTYRPPKTAKDAWDELFSEDFVRFLPFIGTGVDIVEAVQHHRLFKKVARGEGTPEDEAKVNEILLEQQRGSTSGYKIWSQAFMLPAYAIEFGATGAFMEGMAKTGIKKSLGMGASKLAMAKGVTATAAGQEAKAAVTTATKALTAAKATGVAAEITAAQKTLDTATKALANLDGEYLRLSAIALEKAPTRQFVRRGAEEMGRGFGRILPAAEFTGAAKTPYMRSLEWFARGASAGQMARATGELGLAKDMAGALELHKGSTAFSDKTLAYLYRKHGTAAVDKMLKGGAEGIRTAMENIKGTYMREALSSAGRGMLEGVPRTALNPLRLAEGTTRYMTPRFGLAEDEQGQLHRFLVDHGDSFWRALRKSFTEQYAENASENMGQVFDALFTVAGRVTPTLLTNTILEQAAAGAVASGNKEAFKAFLFGGPGRPGLLNQMSVSGWAGEFSEELLGDLLNWTLGGTDYEGSPLMPREEMWPMAVALWLNPLTVASSAHQHYYRHRTAFLQNAQAAMDLSHIAVEGAPQQRAAKLDPTRKGLITAKEGYQHPFESIITPFNQLLQEEKNQGGQPATSWLGRTWQGVKEVASRRATVTDVKNLWNAQNRVDLAQLHHAMEEVGVFNDGIELGEREARAYNLIATFLSPYHPHLVTDADYRQALVEVGMAFTEMEGGGLGFYSETDITEERAGDERNYVEVGEGRYVRKDRITPHANTDLVGQFLIDPSKLDEEGIAQAIHLAPGLIHVVDRLSDKRKVGSDPIAVSPSLFQKSWDELSKDLGARNEMVRALAPYKGMSMQERIDMAKMRYERVQNAFNIVEGNVKGEMPITLLLERSPRYLRTKSEVSSEFPYLSTDIESLAKIQAESLPQMYDADGKEIPREDLYVITKPGGVEVKEDGIAGRTVQISIDVNAPRHVIAEEAAHGALAVLWEKLHAADVGDPTHQQTRVNELLLALNHSPVEGSTGYQFLYDTVTAVRERVEKNEGNKYSYRMQQEALAAIDQFSQFLQEPFLGPDALLLEELLVKIFKVHRAGIQGVAFPSHAPLSESWQLGADAFLLNPVVQTEILERTILSPQNALGLDMLINKALNENKALFKFLTSSIDITSDKRTWNFAAGSTRLGKENTAIREYSMRSAALLEDIRALENQRAEATGSEGTFVIDKQLNTLRRHLAETRNTLNALISSMDLSEFGGKQEQDKVRQGLLNNIQREFGEEVVSQPPGFAPPAEGSKTPAQMWREANPKSLANEEFAFSITQQNPHLGVEALMELGAESLTDENKEATRALIQQIKETGGVITTPEQRATRKKVEALSRTKSDRASGHSSLPKLVPYRGVDGTPPQRDVPNLPPGVTAAEYWLYAGSRIDAIVRAALQNESMQDIFDEMKGQKSFQPFAEFLEVTEEDINLAREIAELRRNAASQGIVLLGGRYRFEGQRHADDNFKTSAEPDIIAVMPDGSLQFIDVKSRAWGADNRLRNWMDPKSVDSAEYGARNYYHMDHQTQLHLQKRLAEVNGFKVSGLHVLGVAYAPHTRGEQVSATQPYMRLMRGNDGAPATKPHLLEGRELTRLYNEFMDVPLLRTEHDLSEGGGFSYTLLRPQLTQQRPQPTSERILQINPTNSRLTNPEAEKISQEARKVREEQQNIDNVDLALSAILPEVEIPDVRGPTEANEAPKSLADLEEGLARFKKMPSVVEPALPMPPASPANLSKHTVADPANFIASLSQSYALRELGWNLHKDGLDGWLREKHAALYTPLDPSSELDYEGLVDSIDPEVRNILATERAVLRELQEAAKEAKSVSALQALRGVNKAVGDAMFAANHAAGTDSKFRSSFHDRVLSAFPFVTSNWGLLREYARQAKIPNAEHEGFFLHSRNLTDVARAVSSLWMPANLQAVQKLLSALDREGDPERQQQLYQHAMGLVAAQKELTRFRDFLQQIADDSYQPTGDDAVMDSLTEDLNTDRDGGWGAETFVEQLLGTGPVQQLRSAIASVIRTLPADSPLQMSQEAAARHTMLDYYSRPSISESGEVTYDTKYLKMVSSLEAYEAFMALKTAEEDAETLARPQGSRTAQEYMDDIADALLRTALRATQTVGVDGYASSVFTSDEEANRYMRRNFNRNFTAAEKELESAAQPDGAFRLKLPATDFHTVQGALITMASTVSPPVLGIRVVRDAAGGISHVVEQLNAADAAGQLIQGVRDRLLDQRHTNLATWRRVILGQFIGREVVRHADGSATLPGASASVLPGMSRVDVLHQLLGLDRAMLNWMETNRPDLLAKLLPFGWAYKDEPRGLVLRRNRDGVPYLPQYLVNPARLQPNYLDHPNVHLTEPIPGYRDPATGELVPYKSEHDAWLELRREERGEDWDGSYEFDYLFANPFEGRGRTRQAFNGHHDLWFATEREALAYRERYNIPTDVYPAAGDLAVERNDLGVITHAPTQGFALRSYDSGVLGSPLINLLGSVIGEQATAKGLVDTIRTEGVAGKTSRSGELFFQELVKQLFNFLDSRAVYGLNTTLAAMASAYAEAVGVGDFVAPGYRNYKGEHTASTQGRSDLYRSLEPIVAKLRRRFGDDARVRVAKIDGLRGQAVNDAAQVRDIIDADNSRLSDADIATIQRALYENSFLARDGKTELYWHVLEQYADRDHIYAIPLPKLNAQEALAALGVLLDNGEFAGAKFRSVAEEVERMVAPEPGDDAKARAEKERQVRERIGTLEAAQERVDKARTDLRDFVANEILHNTLYQLMVGNTGSYKDRADATKRISTVTTPGISPHLGILAKRLGGSRVVNVVAPEELPSDPELRKLIERFDGIEIMMPSLRKALEASFGEAIMFGGDVNKRAYFRDIKGSDAVDGPAETLKLLVSDSSHADGRFQLKGNTMAMELMDPESFPQFTGTPYELLFNYLTQLQASHPDAHIFAFPSATKNFARSQATKLEMRGERVVSDSVTYIPLDIQTLTLVQDLRRVPVLVERSLGSQAPGAMASMTPEADAILARDQQERTESLRKAMVDIALGEDADARTRWWADILDHKQNPGLFDAMVLYRQSPRDSAELSRQLGVISRSMVAREALRLQVPRVELQELPGYGLGLRPFERVNPDGKGGWTAAKDGSHVRLSDIYVSRVHHPDGRRLRGEETVSLKDMVKLFNENLQGEGTPLDAENLAEAQFRELVSAYMVLSTPTDLASELSNEPDKFAHIYDSDGSIDWTAIERDKDKVTFRGEKVMFYRVPLSGPPSMTFARVKGVLGNIRQGAIWTHEGVQLGAGSDFDGDARYLIPWTRSETGAALDTTANKILDSYSNAYSDAKNFGKFSRSLADLHTQAKDVVRSLSSFQENPPLSDRPWTHPDHFQHERTSNTMIAALKGIFTNIVNGMAVVTPMGVALKADGVAEFKFTDAKGEVRTIRVGQAVNDLIKLGKKVLGEVGHSEQELIAAGAKLVDPDGRRMDILQIWQNIAFDGLSLGEVGPAAWGMNEVTANAMAALLLTDPVAIERADKGGTYTAEDAWERARLVAEFMTSPDMRGYVAHVRSRSGVTETLERRGKLVGDTSRLVDGESQYLEFNDSALSTVDSQRALRKLLFGGEAVSSEGLATSIAILARDVYGLTRDVPIHSYARYTQQLHAVNRVLNNELPHLSTQPFVLQGWRDRRATRAQRRLDSRTWIPSAERPLNRSIEEIDNALAGMAMDDPVREHLEADKKAIQGDIKALRKRLKEAARQRLITLEIPENLKSDPQIRDKMMGEARKALQRRLDQLDADQDMLLIVPVVARGEDSASRVAEQAAISFAKEHSTRVIVQLTPLVREAVGELFPHINGYVDELNQAGVSVSVTPTEGIGAITAVSHLVADNGHTVMLIPNPSQNAPHTRDLWYSVTDVFTKQGLEYVYAEPRPERTEPVKKPKTTYTAPEILDLIESDKAPPVPEGASRDLFAESVYATAELEAMEDGVIPLLGGLSSAWNSLQMARGLWYDHLLQNNPSVRAVLRDLANHPANRGGELSAAAYLNSVLTETQTWIELSKEDRQAPLRQINLEDAEKAHKASGSLTPWKQVRTALLETKGKDVAVFTSPDKTRTAYVFKVGEREGWHAYLPYAGEATDLAEGNQGMYISTHYSAVDPLLPTNFAREGEYERAIDTLLAAAVAKELVNHPLTIASNQGSLSAWTQQVMQRNLGEGLFSLAYDGENAVVNHPLLRNALQSAHTLRSREDVRLMEQRAEKPLLGTLYHLLFAEPSEDTIYGPTFRADLGSPIGAIHMASLAAMIRREYGNAIPLMAGIRGQGWDARVLQAFIPLALDTNPAFKQLLESFRTPELIAQVLMNTPGLLRGAVQQGQLPEDKSDNRPSTQYRQGQELMRDHLRSFDVLLSGDQENPGADLTPLSHAWEQRLDSIYVDWLAQPVSASFDVSRLLTEALTPSEAAATRDRATMLSLDSLLQGDVETSVRGAYSDYAAGAVQFLADLRNGPADTHLAVDIQELSESAYNTLIQRTVARITEAQDFTTAAANIIPHLDIQVALGSALAGVYKNGLVAQVRSPLYWSGSLVRQAVAEIQKEVVATLTDPGLYTSQSQRGGFVKDAVAAHNARKFNNEAYNMGQDFKPHIYKITPVMASAEFARPTADFGPVMGAERLHLKHREVAHKFNKFRMLMGLGGDRISAAQGLIRTNRHTYEQNAETGLWEVFRSDGTRQKGLGEVVDRYETMSGAAAEVVRLNKAERRLPRELAQDLGMAGIELAEESWTRKLVEEALASGDMEALAEALSAQVWTGKVARDKAGNALLEATTSELADGQRLHILEYKTKGGKRYLLIDLAEEVGRAWNEGGGKLSVDEARRQGARRMLEVVDAIQSTFRDGAHMLNTEMTSYVDRSLFLPLRQNYIYHSFLRTKYGALPNTLPVSAKSRERLTSAAPRKFLTYKEAALIRGLEMRTADPSEIVQLWTKEVAANAQSTLMITEGMSSAHWTGKPLWLPVFSLTASRDALRQRLKAQGYSPAEIAERLSYETSISNDTVKEAAQTLRRAIIRHIEDVHRRSALPPGIPEDIKPNQDPRLYLKVMIDSYADVLVDMGYRRLQQTSSKFASVESWWVLEYPESRDALRDPGRRENTTRNLLLMLEGSKEGRLARNMAAIRDWAKRVSLSLSAFHGFSLFESLAAVLGVPESARMLLTSPWTGRQTYRDLRNALNKARIDPEFGGKWVGAGMSLDMGQNPDYFAGTVLKHIDVMLRETTVGRTPVLKQALTFFNWSAKKADQLLWRELMPMFKLHAAETVLAQQREAFQSEHGREMTTAEHQQTLHDIAMYVNKAFGGLDWTQFTWATPKTMSMMRWIFFAPDWTLSSLLVAGAGEVPGLKQALREDTSDLARGQMISKYWPAMLLIVQTGIPALVQAMIKLMFGLDDDDVAWVPAGNEYTKSGWGGTGIGGHIDISPIAHMLGGDPEAKTYMRLAKQSTEVLEGWVGNAAGTFYGKTSPAVRIVVEQAFGVRNLSGWDMDFKGEPFMRSWVSGQRDGFMGSRTMAIAEKVMPMSITSLLHGRPSTFFAPASRGQSKWSLRKEYARYLISFADGATGAEVRRNPHARQNLEAFATHILEAADRNGVSRDWVKREGFALARQNYYSDLAAAVERNDEKKMEKLAACLLRLNTKKSQIDRMLKNRLPEGLTPEQRQTYLKALGYEI